MRLDTLLTLEEGDLWMIKMLGELSSMLSVRFNEEMLALYGEDDLNKILNRVENSRSFTAADARLYRSVLEQTGEERIAVHTCHPSPLGAAIIAQSKDCLSRLSYVMREMHSEARLAAERQMIADIEERMREGA